MNLMTPDILQGIRQMIQDDTLIRFYKSKEWHIIRATRKRLDNNECQTCKRNGRYSPAEMVHHIKEVRNYPELALDLSNTECECNACHNKLHPEKLSGYNRTTIISDERW